MVLRRCSLCDRNFTKAEHYLRHQRSHTKEKPYECLTCKKRFSRSDVLFRHSKLHAQQDGDSRGDKPRSHSSANGSQPALDIAMPTSSDSQCSGGSQAQTEPNAESDITSPRQYSEPRMHLSRHLSISDVDRMPYSMSQPQQTPISHLTTSQTYNGPDFSPMQDFSSASLSAQMNREVYDPQLVTVDPHMGQNDVVSEAFGLRTSTNSLVDQPLDMLQFWLSQADDEFGYVQLNMSESQNGVYNPISDGRPMQPLTRSHASQMSEAIPISNIPEERFARVQSCWLSGTEKIRRLGPTIWDDVIASPGPNMFTLPQDSSAPPAFENPDSRWGIGAELRQRLEVEFGMQPAQYSSMSRHDSFPRSHSVGVPPPEVLDICLDAYFRRFHPLAPFVHVGTFCASSVPLPLLYAMCLLGLSAVKENVGSKYMKHAFKNILRRVMTDLVADATTDATAARRLSTYATGCLTLHLAALSGDQDQIAQAQVLHASLLSNAQKQGLFSVEEVRLDISFMKSFSEAVRWQRWTRMETVKRLTVCLLTIDWWYSAYTSTCPIVRPEGIQICVPADNILFSAESFSRWAQVKMAGNHKLTFPLLRPRTFNLQGSLDAFICLDPPLHAFAQCTLLTIIKHSQCDAQHRHFLTVDDDSSRDEQLIPWRSFGDDMRASSLVPVTVGLAPIITATPKITDLNALVLWHNLCMTLNSNVRIFELAAGRGGAGPAGKALRDIALWSQTPSARRACIHAAQIFKLLHNRKVSDPISINVLTALFYAALVLGLYLLVTPSNREVQIGGNNTYDVLDDVNWVMIGDLGMVEEVTPGNSPGSVFENAKSSSPAAVFIESGGAVSIGGATANGGYMSARRTFVDFAHLMDEMGTWKPKTLSKILHIMSDVLEEPV